MAFDTIIQQGRFTSVLGGNVTLSLRSDVDWMEVINFTNAAATGDDGCVFKWRRGFAAGAAIRMFKDGGANNLNLGTLTTGGFTLVDTSGTALGNPVVITAVSDNVDAAISTGSTTGVTAGTIVRLSGVTGSPGLAGIDWTVDNIAGDTSFDIAVTLPTAPGAAGTAGNYRIVNFDPIYYPRRRTIVNITRANPAVVTMSIPSGYTVGQQVRFHVPEAVNGMIEMDGLDGTVTAVNDATATQTITVDIDASGFTAFTFATAAESANPLTRPSVVPFGIDTAQALTSAVDILGDATVNLSVLGMILGGGANNPAGANNDVIYWQAGKSFNVNNL